MTEAVVQPQKGQLSFDAIERLEDDWWTSPPPNDPQAVWNTWDRDAYYLWGANSSNYQGIAIGQILGGDGMAGASHGPSVGRAHPHYVGVITMDAADLPKNDAVFQDLAGYMANGKNVVVPTYRGEWSLGTGIGKSIPHWGDVQEYLLSQILLLGRGAGLVTIPAGTYWPDWRPGMNGAKHSIATLDDLVDIISLLSGKSGGGAAAVPSVEAAVGTGDQFHPAPKKVRIGNEDYSLVAFYYPGKPAHCDDDYHAGCFGNFYPCTVALDHPDPLTGKSIVPTPRFQVAEAAFQALKWWSNDDIRQDFEKITDGDAAYRLSQTVAADPKTPPDDTYAGLGRVGAMEAVVWQKFTGNAAFQTALLATEDAYLIEHATGAHDTFWSDGGRDANGNVYGKNMLGRTLMKIRGKLKNGKPAPQGTDNDQIVAQFKNAV